MAETDNKKEKDPVQVTGNGFWGKVYGYLSSAGVDTAIGAALPGTLEKLIAKIPNEQYKRYVKDPFGWWEGGLPIAGLIIRAALAKTKIPGEVVTDIFEAAVGEMKSRNKNLDHAVETDEEYKARKTKGMKLLSIFIKLSNGSPMNFFDDFRTMIEVFSEADQAIIIDGLVGMPEKQLQNLFKLNSITETRRAISVSLGVKMIDPAEKEAEVEVIPVKEEVHLDVFKDGGRIDVALKEWKQKLLEKKLKRGKK